MTLRTRTWFGLLWLLVPLTLFLFLLYDPSLPKLRGEYPLADQVQALSVGVLGHPFACGIAAMVGSRVRAAGLWRGSMRRGTTAVVVNAIGANVLVLFALLLATMMWRSSIQSGSLTPVPVLVPLVALQAVAFTTLGFGLGAALPPIYAIPVSLLVPYVAIGFTPASETLWLRHLWEISTNCCFVDESLSWRAIAAHVLALLATTLLGYALVRSAIRRGRAGARRGSLTWVGVASSALVAACVVASPLGASPAVARPGELSCARAADTDLCLWPEHERARPMLFEQLARARTVSRAVGSTWPTRFTEAPASGLRWPVAKVEAQPRVTAEEMRVGLVGSLVPACAPTDGETLGIATATAQASETAQLAAWWALRLGAPLDEATADSEPGQVARSVATRSDAAQGAWVREAERKALAACSPG